MRIGLLTTEFIPGWGGIASYCKNLCKAISNDVDLHVITNSNPGNGDITKHASAETDFPNVTIHNLSTSNGVFLSDIRYQLLAARKIPSFIKERNIDIVHSAGPLADQLLRIIGNDIPHIVTYHSTLQGQRQGISNSKVGFWDLDSSEKTTILTYPLARAYESLSLARTTNIIAVSNAVRKDLMDQYGYDKAITVIHNGIDLELFQPYKKNNSKPRVIFSGRLIATKGPQVVMKAIPHVLREHKDAVFIFAGAGDKRPYVRLAHKMDIPHDRIEFCHVDYEYMPQLYNSAHILVLPSLLESFPMSILEGMACGLPAIASDVGDVSELVKDGITGFLVPKGDHMALATKINYLIENPSLRILMSQNSRELVSDNYSAELMGKKTLDLYDRAVKN
ncbi:MAG: glycosyltransferase family 4 protein [Chloroflexota bacterium]|nr:glycosyltransferase family 4 protein [Chloroflexota bacterium]